MDVSEYIDAVTSQMRCKRARDTVAKELSDHISDQTEDYLLAGMSPQVAAREAVHQMGDAAEVGMEMDRLHRPRLDRKTLVMIGIFTLIALLVQTMIEQVIRRSGDLSADARMIPLQVAVGILIMVGILYLDYTILGKYPLTLWILLLILPILLKNMRNGGIFLARIDRVILYLLLGFMLPAYVGVIYRYRRKGWLGLFCSVVWLLAGMFVYRGLLNRFFLIGLVGFAGLLLLSYALAKGWYGIPKLSALAVLWGGILTIILLIFLLGIEGNGFSDYQMTRLGAFFHYTELQGEGGYITFHMRETMRDFTFLHPVREWFRGGNFIGYPIEYALSFFIILFQMGILPGVLLICGFVVLFLCMARGVSKQKNILGSLLGMACVLALIIPTVGHLLSCLSLIPYTDVYIPFLYPGWIANASSYTLLGLYLSVYRYTDVVA